MALFVLIVVGVVVAQTWLDWRDTKQGWVVPPWARGTALAGVIGVSLTAATSFASSWLGDPSSQSGSGFGSRLFWLELGFLVCTMGIIVWGARKRRLRLTLLLAGIAAAVAFWLGIALSS
jgi:hypothetical protein